MSPLFASSRTTLLDCLLRSAYLLSVLMLLLVTAASFAPVRAQDEHHPQRGFNAGNAYALSDIENISMSSGNLTFNVPLGSLPPGRGGSPGFTLSLTYNSKLYDTHIEEVTNPEGEKENLTYLNRSLDGGWRYTTPSGYATRVIKRGNEEPLPSCTNATGAFYYQKRAYIWKMQVIYPDGSAHEFRPTGYADMFNDGYFNISPNGVVSVVSLTPGSGSNANCTYNEYQGTTNPMVYYSTDGSYARLVIQHSAEGAPSGAGWTLYFPDGRRVVAATENDPQRTYDRSNNYVDLLNITYNNHPAKKIVDQLGRYMIIETDLANNQDYVYMQGVGGHEVRTTVKWKTNYVRKVYVSSSNSEHRGNFYNAPLHAVWKVVDQIILPAQAGGLNYTFGYNGTVQDLQTLSPGWGELSSVTLPSGAKGTYAYALDGISATGQAAIFPTFKNVRNNRPKQKDLIYRLEYDLSAPASSSPCDPQVETCTTETWIYGPGGQFVSTLEPAITKITGPDGAIQEEYVGDDPNSAASQRAIKTIRPDGTMIERIWSQNRSPGMTGQVVNPYVKTEFTSIKDAVGNYVKTAIKDYSCDKNGNVIATKEYDWVSFTAVPRDLVGRPTAIPSAAPLARVTSKTYYNPTPIATDSTTTSPNAYHQASAPQLLNLAESSEVSDGSQVFSRSEFYYDNYNTTGNLTERRSWDSTQGGITRPLTVANSISTKTQYDPLVLGKVTRTTDARGINTDYIYGAINGVADLYPTETRVAVGTTVQRTSQQEYDFWMGLVKRSTDVDNNVSTSTTYDDLGRALLVLSAENKPEETRTRTEYNDALRRVILRSDLAAVGDEKLVSIQHYDQLGRVRLMRQLENAATQSVDDEAQGIKVQTRYKYSDVNNYKVSSQPFREATASQVPPTSMGWNRAKADNAGRRMESQDFRGTSLPAPWSNNTTGLGQVLTSYDANTTIVTDQAGKVRRSVTDGLGRLIRVDEPDQNNNLDVNGVPFQSTSYSYDALDNLTTVTQGAQTRTFLYDSLGRLTSATNPESGRVCYGTVTTGGQCQANGYDANGNLIYKTDARGVLSTYAYDQLNRNISITYTNDPAGTPTVTRLYDGATNGKGRLWKTETNGDRGSRTTIISYDFLGRPKSQSQQFYDGAWSNPFTVSATYDKAGHVLTQTYPSTHTVNYNYDGAGRTSSFDGNLGDNVLRNYSTEITYSARGAMTKEKFGTTTPVFNKLLYNPRGQLAEIRESTTSATDTSFNRGAIINHYSNYNCWGADCNAPDNNGNLMKQEVHIQDAQGVDTMRWQQYEYDSLNRLIWVREISGPDEIWRQTFVYDRYGNRTIDQDASKTYGTGINKKDFTVNLTNKNRLGVPSGQTGAMDYDDGGNLINNTYSGLGSYLYDAENRITAASPAPVCYPDGEGGQTCNPSDYGSSEYIYDGDGHRVRRIYAGLFGPEETWQVYGMGGELLAEYAQSAVPSTIKKEYGYRNGVLLVTGQKNAGNLNVEWLVTDQLGTPRMVIDKTGSLAGVSRHDYLPFGEELSVGTGGRTTGQGYSAADGVRQKFTSKERDDETGLDYLGARYYSNLNGRLTSVDPTPVTEENFVNPQRWNQYSYVLNNPLASVDPSGRDGKGKGGDKVISVFLHIDADASRDKLVDSRTKKPIGNAPGPWQQVKRESGSKYKIELYGSTEMTGESGSHSAASYFFDESLTNSELSVYVGHGNGPGAGTDAEPFSQEGMLMDSFYYQSTGKELLNPGKEGERSRTGLFLDKPEVSAKVVALFSCDSSRPGGSYFNFTGKGQVVVTINSGKDGVTNAPTLEKAAAAFVKVYAKTGGDYVKAAAAANKVIQDNQNRPKNKNDSVQTKVVN